MAYTTAGTYWLGTQPNISFKVEYETERSNTTVRIRFRVTTNTITGQSYFGYNLVGQPTVNGTTQNSITIKGNSPSQWSSAYVVYFPSSSTWYTTTVSNLAQSYVPISFKFSSNSGNSTVVSFNATIPVTAASTISSSVNFNVGDSTLTVSIARQSSSFTHKVILYVAGSKIEEKTGVGTSTSFNLTNYTNTFYTLITGKNAPVEVTCTTYDSSGNQVGEVKEATGTAYILESRARPTFSTFTYVDSNSTVTALTQNTSIFVKGKSNLKVTIPVANKATAATGASITKYVVKCGNKSITITYSATTDVSGTINGIEDSTVTVSAVDSRGFETSVTVTLNMLQYYSPYPVTATLTRDSGIGTKTRLNFTGKFWNGQFRTGYSNVITVKYRYAVTGSSSYSSYQTLSVTTSGDTVTFNGYINGDFGSEGFNASNSYNIQIQFTDSLSTTSPYTFLLNSGTPIMDFYKNGNTIGVGIGKIWERGGLDVNDNIYVNNNRIYFNTSDSIWASSGIFYFNGKKIDSITAVKEDLVLFMNDSQYVDMSSHPLSNCSHGWILVWSDYADSQAYNRDFVFSFVPKCKYLTSSTSVLCYFPIPINGPTIVNKGLYINNTRISGYYWNTSDNNLQNVVLRATYAW